MSKYTTGEMAKLCGVTVRTVQYYDTRGILIPSELSEGGRRLYSEDDLKRLKVICFLRELDISIDAISQILKEEHPDKVIALLIEQQESVLSDEISEKQEKLEKLRELKNGLKSKAAFSLETIGDIAAIMESKKKLKKTRWMMILTGTPVTMLQWFSTGHDAAMVFHHFLDCQRDMVAVCRLGAGCCSLGHPGQPVLLQPCKIHLPGVPRGVQADTERSFLGKSYPHHPQAYLHPVRTQRILRRSLGRRREMIENAHVETAAFVWLIAGAILWIAVPVAAALIWKVKKKEPVTSILIGAAAFLLFALILEKPIQNVLAFPTAMGLPEHAVSRFLSANPVLLALVAGLFPGVFEETGRLVAFKTVLRKRRNRETSISYGIGHGGFEVILILGLTYIQYIAYAVMINTGMFGTVIDQVAAQAPDQLGSIETVVSYLTGFSFADLGIAFVERLFAVLFHIGASILVFYACRDKKRFWLYPVAIVLHTGMDFIAALSIFDVISLSPWTLEGICAVFGSLTFFGAYFLLYRKDD